MHASRRPGLLHAAMRYPICAVRDRDGVAVPQPFLGVSSLDFGPLLREWPFFCPVAPRPGTALIVRPCGTRSLAVRFSGMEHLRLTLATTAIAVFGLVVAAHSLHSSNEGPPAAPARTIAATATAWADPPARATGPETTGALRSDARASALPSAMPSLQPAVAVSPGAVPASQLPGETAADSAGPSRKAIAAHRPRTSARAAHRSARLRSAKLARTAAVDRAAPAAPPPAQAASASRIDPIGDILRGLGFGRDS